MALNDQYNKSTPNNLRLSKLSSIPSGEDLGFAMSLATNNPRNIVELPWKSAASPQQYTIKVTCALSLEEPRWMLHVGNGAEDDSVIWNYDTPDYQLIFNLITEECNRGSVSNPGAQAMDPRTAGGAGGSQQTSGQYTQQSFQQHQPQPQQQFQNSQPQYQQGQQQQYQQPQPQYQQQGQSFQQQGQQFQQPPFQQQGQPGGQPQQFQQPQQQQFNSPEVQATTNSYRAAAPSGIPLQGLPTTTGNSLPAVAFGAAAASIGTPPPLVTPETVAGQPVIPQSASQYSTQNNPVLQQPPSQYSTQSNPNPYAQQGNPYSQPGNPYAQPSNPYSEPQPTPYVDDGAPFGQHISQQIDQQPSFTPQAAQNAAQSGNNVNQFGQSNPPYGQQPPQNPMQQQQGSGGYPASQAGFQPVAPQPAQGQPIARPTEMPSSRLFTLPDPASVKNPAERLIDNATSAAPTPEVKAPTPLPSPVKFDRAAVDTVFKMLTDEDLGFLSHGALMFFTVREFSRFQRNNVPFSIVLFELAVLSGTRWEPMPLNLVKDVGKQLFGVMRPLDLIAHYENQDFAILLPHTSREDSFTVVQRLHEMLSSTAVAPGMQPGQAQIFCGISTIPDDCAHPGVAIAAALEAKAQAKATGKPVLRFCDI